MLKERQSREGVQSNSKDSEPTLVLPQLAKLETKAYSPSKLFACHMLQLMHYIHHKLPAAFFKSCQMDEDIGSLYFSVTPKFYTKQPV